MPHEVIELIAAMFAPIALLMLIAIGMVIWATCAKAQSAQSVGWGIAVADGFRSAVSVTPSDSTDLQRAPTKGLLVGDTAACAVKFIAAEDPSAQTETATLQPGRVYPLQLRRIEATGTACTHLVALY